MPLRHVYGKRSRAIYDPNAAFVSPHRTVGNPGDDRPKPAKKGTGKTVKRFEDGGDEKNVRGKRKPLGEINANEVVQTAVIPVEKEGKGTGKGARARRTRRVVEDSSEEDVQMDKVVEDAMAKETEDVEDKLQVEVQVEEISEPEPVFEADNVPLFCDDHGYDTEEEEAPEASKETTVLREDYIQDTQRPAQEELDTLSISILPPTPPASDEYSEHCSSLLELSSHRMTDFTEWTNQLSSHFSMTKIAEASFGEVYRLSLLNRLSGFERTDESVFKIIALKPSEGSLPTDGRRRNAVLKRAEAMSKPEDVATEVRLLERMNDVPGFTNFRDVRVVKGRPAAPFVKAFKDFNVRQKARKKELSVFPDPAKKTSYSEDQLWAVIEMQDAGTDLEVLVEQGEVGSVWAVWDVFWQVVLSLAKGEECAEFEHRDLHLGNICVRKPPSSVTDGEGAIDTKKKLNFTGLETTIIDYTISRALMHPQPDLFSSSSADQPEETAIAFKNLHLDPELFEGDSTEEYQYDIYRYMRSAVFLSNPYADFPSAREGSHARPLPAHARDRSWRDYHPETNLLWLHYLLYKLLEQLSWPSATKQPPRRNEVAHAEWKRANDLEHVLLRVQEVLDPGRLFDEENPICSARELVMLALNEGWIDHGDIDGEWGDETVEEALAAQFEDLGLEVQGGEDDGEDDRGEGKRSRERKKGRGAVI